MKRLIITIVAMTSIITHCMGQEKEYSTIKEMFRGRKVDMLFGTSNFKSIEVGISLGRTSRNILFNTKDYGDFHLCSETIINESTPIEGFKIGASGASNIFYAGWDLITYTDFKKTDIALKPQLGLSIFGLVDLYYGYNIMIDKKLEAINNHNICLRISFGQNQNKEWKELNLF